jgi:hypothetical protein
VWDINQNTKLGHDGIKPMIAKITLNGKILHGGSPSASDIFYRGPSEIDIDPRSKTTSVEQPSDVCVVLEPERDPMLSESDWSNTTPAGGPIKNSAKFGDPIKSIYGTNTPEKTPQTDPFAKLDLEMKNAKQKYGYSGFNVIETTRVK